MLFFLCVQRSSRGRTLKPASSGVTGNTSMSIYSYDMRGNFIGLSSPVIDLTLSDTSGYVAGGNESLLLKGQQRPRVNREPAATERERVEEVRGRRGRGGEERGSEKERCCSSEEEGWWWWLGGEGRKKKPRQRRRTSVIPAALRKMERLAALSGGGGGTSTECEASEDTG